MIFQTKKKDKRVKANKCANTSTQHNILTRMKPQAMTKSHLINTVISAKQKKNIMTSDIPNIFVQTKIETKTTDKQIIIKVRSKLVNMQMKFLSEDYQDFCLISRKSENHLH